MSATVAILTDLRDLGVSTAAGVSSTTASIAKFVFLTSQAAGISGTEIKTNFIWRLVSEADGVGGAVVGSPYFVEVLGEIDLIPWFDFATPVVPAPPTRFVWVTTASGVSAFSGRPNFVWSLVSEVDAVSGTHRAETRALSSESDGVTSSSTSPRKLNISGNIGAIPYF